MKDSKEKEILDKVSIILNQGILNWSYTNPLKQESHSRQFPKALCSGQSGLTPGSALKIVD